LDYLTKQGVQFPVLPTESCLVNMQQIEAKECEKHAESKEF